MTDEDFIKLCQVHVALGNGHFHGKNCPCNFPGGNSDKHCSTDLSRVLLSTYPPGIMSIYFVPCNNHLVFYLHRKLP